MDVKFLEAIDGDSDGDGSVQLLDLDTLGQNFGLAGDWTDGDFTGDGQVHLLDLLGQNFGMMVGGDGRVSSVPEPCTFVLFYLSTMILFARVRRRAG